MSARITSWKMFFFPPDCTGSHGVTVTGCIACMVGAKHFVVPLMQNCKLAGFFFFFVNIYKPLLLPHCNCDLEFLNQETGDDSGQYGDITNLLVYICRFWVGTALCRLSCSSQMITECIHWSCLAVKKKNKLLFINHHLIYDFNLWDFFFFRTHQTLVI